ALLHLGEARLDRVRDGDGVGPRLLADVEADGLVAVDAHARADVGVTVLDASDITKPRRGAIHRGGDDDLAKALDVGELAERADVDLLLAFGEATARHREIGGADLLDDDGRVEVDGVELVAVDRNLDLALHAALDVDRGDAIDLLERWLDDVFGELAQLR